MSTTILLLLGIVIGAIAHELDIKRSIEKYGHSNYSTWLCKIKGELVDGE